MAGKCVGTFISLSVILAGQPYLHVVHAPNNETTQRTKKHLIIRFFITLDL